MSVLGIVGVCLAVLAPASGRADLNTVKCYSEKPIKYKTASNCQTGNMLILRMGGREILRRAYLKYVKTLSVTPKRKVVYRFRSRCIKESG